MTAGFAAGGSDLATAQQQALASIYGLTLRQASMLSFIQIFRLLGVLCLVMLPLVLIMRKPQHRGGSAAHAIAE